MLLYWTISSQHQAVYLSLYISLYVYFFFQVDIDHPEGAFSSLDVDK